MLVYEVNRTYSATAGEDLFKMTTKSSNAIHTLGMAFFLPVRRADHHNHATGCGAGFEPMARPSRSRASTCTSRDPKDGVFLKPEEQAQATAKSVHPVRSEVMVSPVR